LIPFKDVIEIEALKRKFNLPFSIERIFNANEKLKYYDFNKLYLWFTLLDELDAKSNMIPSMASYYFAQTQNTKDSRYIVDYLYEHSVKDVKHKWWWLLQAIYLSMHKLDDMDLALKVSKPLVDKDVPIWAQQMAAVVREKRGEMEDAMTIMESIKDNAENGNIPEKDLRYMVYFVKERLGKLEKSKEFQAIQPSPDTPETASPPKGVLPN
jgi:hypothetical protein